MECTAGRIGSERRVWRRDFLLQSLVISNWLKRPQQWNQDHGSNPQDQIQWQANFDEIGEAIAAGAVNHHVRLVADGRCKGERGGKSRCDQERSWIDLKNPGCLQAEWERKSRSAVVCNQFIQNHRAEIDRCQCCYWPPRSGHIY